MRKRIRIILLCLFALMFCNKAGAISFALDSIAQWGKFPNFCVKTYRWGDRFFNGYDTTYVKGTGTKFNIKLTSQSWIDHYRLDIEPDIRMDMISDVASNVGIHLSYLAVTIGYDMNINKFFNGYERSRKRLNFGFNCALFAAEFYVQNNDLTTRISNLDLNGKKYEPDLKFDGISTDRWGFDVYYFLNNKRYSQAAAFNFSRLQQKSQGSWYFGFSFCNQRYNFDFGRLPEGLLGEFPTDWDDYTYRVNTRTYSLKVGYGYNWVINRHWLLAVTESPLIGYRTGFVNDYTKRSLGLSNIFQFSVVYNHKRFFMGLLGNVYTNLTRDPKTTLVGNVMSATFSIGYRFNIW